MVLIKDLTSRNYSPPGCCSFLNDLLVVLSSLITVALEIQQALWVCWDHWTNAVECRSDALHWTGLVTCTMTSASRTPLVS